MLRRNKYPEKKGNKSKEIMRYKFLSVYLIASTHTELKYIHILLCCLEYHRYCYTSAHFFLTALGNTGAQLDQKNANKT